MKFLEQNVNSYLNLNNSSIKNIKYIAARHYI